MLLYCRGRFVASSLPGYFGKCLVLGIPVRGDSVHAASCYSLISDYKSHGQLRRLHIAYPEKGPQERTSLFLGRVFETTLIRLLKTTSGLENLGALAANLFQTVLSGLRPPRLRRSVLALPYNSYPFLSGMPLTWY